MDIFQSSDDHDGNVYRCGTWKRYSAACGGDPVCVDADDGRNNRAAILRVRGSDYIESSEAIGVSQIQMILKHMIPNAAGIMIIYFVGFLAVSIMMMSSMSYIGVGLTAPTPEWGLILNDGKAYLTSAPYMMLFPALMIMITCFAFNLMGDGLRDAFDPKMK